MTTWLVIGSSPTAIEGTNRARAEQQIDKTITCNRGIVIEPQPDFYFLSDAIACKMWNAHAREVQRNGGTCVTLRRNDHALQSRGVDWFDEILDEAPPYECFKLSGLWCLEYAAVNGAKTIVMSGMDGWSRDGTKMDYFDPSIGKVKHCTHWSRDIIQPRCQLLADKYPSTAWVQYGQPEFEVRSANWTVVEL